MRADRSVSGPRSRRCTSSRDRRSPTRTHGGGAESTETAPSRDRTPALAPHGCKGRPDRASEAIRLRQRLRRSAGGDDGLPAEIEMLTRLLVGAIRLYQAGVSPLLPSACRYDPSCSEYARIAIERHGVGQGLWLAARRVGRCHPFGGFGPDPVPEPRSPEPELERSGP